MVGLADTSPWVLASHLAKTFVDKAALSTFSLPVLKQSVKRSIEA